MPQQDSPLDGQATSSPRGVSLANLFLLITVCGVLVAHVIPVLEAARKANNLFGFIPWILGGAVAGMFVGIPVGMCQRRPWLGVALGIPLGLMVGAIIGPLATLPAERFGELVRISFAGGATLVVFALLARIFGR